ncbi:sushi, von Willebrand factor type A, EGF and pentraxin domain-containing protein 1-like [Dreissena polymorpha]|nr:sushi, von Willebrand factor type A, EGF and pentraxin domain-containing protein 1-like [Dreissena polymorpha]
MLPSQYSTLILVSVLVMLVPVHVQTETYCTLPGYLYNGYYERISNTLIIRCDAGYTLIGSPQQVCNSLGMWDPPEIPKCVSNVKCTKPYAVNGNITGYRGSNYSVGDTFTFTCSSLYAIQYDDNIVREVAFRCSQDGIWVSSSGFKVEPACTVSVCDAPPQVPYSRTDMSEHYSMPVDGEIVLYTCYVGYILVDPKANQLQCHKGEWQGSVPSCVVKQTCGRPNDIQNGQFYNPDNPDTNRLYDFEYMLGSHVKYYCNYGYKLVGDATLFCEQDSKWSHYPPQCISVEDSTKYCPGLRSINNGRCFCESKSDIQYCEPFYAGLHVECVCDSGYTMRGESIITCKRSGEWDYDIPACFQDHEINGDTRGESASSQYHMSTLAIVVATACSVLGVLLLVMVVMVFRRRKPHPPRLCRPSSVPPPYSRVHSNSLDEHDRMLLIGYDNTQITLPSYEEATRRGNSPISGNFLQRSGGQGQVGEYRPLPSIPSNFRSSQLPHRDTTSRHSIITTSTMNRDGISEREVFGSIDTVNVSVSDASTAVTIESMDSASSHYSNMSRRANAGSINSSNGSLVTEDVPLLDSAQRDNEIDSVSNQEDVTDKPDS